ncbi:MAG: hypothetical protein OJF49_004498 [Ktedonobacterales bacterium]|jgi:signal transduction histidine kinase|nr:MAG: hypothetical protein OJF49_004498 [Ktedonobacterales bacterium]
MFSLALSSPLDWEQVFEAISDPICVVTADYRLIHANKAYRETFGLDQPPTGTHECFSLAAHQDHPCENCPLPQTVATRSPAFVRQIRDITNADGTTEARMYQRWTYPMFNQDGEVDRVVEMLKDVTEQEHLREAQNQANALREADRLKTELLATINHELRSPLTSIKGYAETLARHEDRLAPLERHEFLLAIAEASDRLGATIDLFLEMSQLANQSVKLDRVPVDGARMARDAVATASQRLSTRDAERYRFSVQVADATLTPLVAADPRRLRIVFDQLLENAVKYTPDGGDIQVEIRSSASGSAQPSIEIIVRDSGIGMPPEQLQHIFERFHRINTQLTREDGGIGLGLAVCQRIVTLHDGSLWAESTPGQGSAFHILLPRSAEEIAS